MDQLFMMDQLDVSFGGQTIRFWCVCLYYELVFFQICELVINNHKHQISENNQMIVNTKARRPYILH
jgi:hypothetical protein